MVFDIFTLVEGLWIILPAYAANGLAPLIKFKKTRHPIDGNKTFRGKPVFGRGKTWEGFLVGVFCAIVISAVEMLAYPFLPWNLSEQIHGVKLNIVPMGPLLGLLLGFGTMTGDLAGSFIKRRLGLARGRPAPILDQDDFVVGAFACASLLVAIELGWAVLYMIITPLLHLLASVIGYRLKIKKEPW